MWLAYSKALAEEAEDNGIPAHTEGWRTRAEYVVLLIIWWDLSATAAYEGWEVRFQARYQDQNYVWVQPIQV